MSSALLRLSPHQLKLRRNEMMHMSEIDIAFDPTKFIVGCVD
jgi:hypothetical protein